MAWSYSGTANSGFKISVSTDGGRTFPDERVVTSASARSAQITGLSGGTTYSFTVRAYNGIGNSTFSNVRGGTTLIDPPAAPAVSAPTVVSDSQIDLAWSDVAGETQYTLERSLTGTGGWSLVATLAANVTSYPDTGLDANTTYHYRIRAANSTGSSANTAFDPATTRLATPTNFTATAAPDTVVDLAWSAVAGATGYTVQRLDGSTYVDVTTMGGAVTSYAVSGLAAETNYTFRVFATGASGNFSAPASAGATTQPAPQEPSNDTPMPVIHDPGAVPGESFIERFATRGNLLLAGSTSANGGLGGAVLINASTGAVLRRFANPAPDASSLDCFGSAVALIGNRIAIAAPDQEHGGIGKLYIYDGYADDVPDRVIESPVPLYYDGSSSASPGFGFGQVLLAAGDDLFLQYMGGNGGLGEVRRYDPATGVHEETYVGPSASAHFGNAIAIDPAGTRLLVGSSTDLGVIVSELNVASGNILHQFPIHSTYALALAYGADANTFFVSAIQLEEVYQYGRSNLATPTVVHTYNSLPGTGFGTTVAVSGNHLLITAAAEATEVRDEGGAPIGSRIGAAYVFNTATHALVQRIENPTVDLLSGSGSPDSFGTAAGVFGSGAFAIADPTDDDGSLLDVGGMYTFDA